MLPLSAKSPVQLLQVVAEFSQVAQEESQGSQTLVVALGNVPSGQVESQTEFVKKVDESHFVQVMAVPAHSRQVGSHAWQTA